METTEKKEMTSYLACAIAEGFCEGEGASFEEQLKAWAYLIKTRMCWSLQGWYGRNASAFINKGIISADGVIDWDVVNLIMDDNYTDDDE